MVMFQNVSNFYWAQGSKMGFAALAEVTVFEWSTNKMHLGYMIDGDGAVRGLPFDLPISATCTPAP